MCRQIVPKTSGTGISFSFLRINVIDQEMEAAGGVALEVISIVPFITLTFKPDQ